MPQSLSAVRIHIIFSTKTRFPFLKNSELRAETHAYMGGILKKLNCPPIIIGGTEDHAHILCCLRRTISQADLVKEIKRVSSVWIKQYKPELEKFAWQNGYGVFSVSESNLEKVHAYITGQEEHHRKHTFQEEYRDFLQKHGLEWDERYVWE